MRSRLVGAAAAAAAGGVGAGYALRRRTARRPAPALDGLGGPLPGEPRTIRTTDGVLLAAVVGGVPDAPVTLVFVHGYTLDMRCWHFAWRGLGDRARLVAYDQRSHGRSARGELRTPILDQVAADLTTVLDAVAATGPVVLVGHSMGGMAVLALADAHPELFGDRVVGVALLATSAGRLGEVTFGLPAVVAAVGQRVLPWMVPQLGRHGQLVDWTRAATPQPLVQMILRWFSFRSPVDPRVAAFAADMIGRTPFEVVAAFFPAFADHDKLEALEVLSKVETLILVGDGDLLTPADHSREMARAVPGAELVVVPDAGHLVLFEHPDVVEAALAALLDRVEPA